MSDRTQESHTYGEGPQAGNRENPANFPALSGTMDSGAVASDNTALNGATPGIPWGGDPKLPAEPNERIG